MKNTQERINNRLDTTQEWISDLENTIVEITQWKQQKGKKKLNEDNFKDFWDNVKHTNICIMGVPERQDREKGAKNLFKEIMAWNFPNLEKETDIQV